MKRGRGRLTAMLSGAAVAAAVTAGLLTAFTAYADAPGKAVPQTGAVFNNPTGTAEEQYAIRDHVLDLVESTESGETITMSLYNVTDHERGFADALVAASQRGVAVRVVLESEHAATGSAKAIVDGLGTDRTKPSWSVVCSSGCHGTNINHNKFYLFSNVGGQTDVVVQASANFTISNATRFWNNAVTFVGNAPLYDGYQAYFDDLARNQDDLSYYTTFNAGDVKGYHFPRSGTGDTVYNALGNVGCGSASDPTVIRIGMWYIGRTPVAEKLASLARSGCKVDVVYTEMRDGPAEELEGTPNVRLKQLPESGDYIIHSKYFIVDGMYGDADRKVVFTGSPNFSDKALRVNDETMLRIYSAEIHDQYATNFAAMFEG
ncbi:MAG: phospholipase D-like domain-containing protein [Stackebrandtia sp.]